MAASQKALKTPSVPSGGSSSRSPSPSSLPFDIPEPEREVLLSHVSSFATALPRPPTTAKTPLVALSPEDLAVLADKNNVEWADEGEPEDVALWETVANAVLWTIPFGFLFSGMDYAVHAQFGVDLPTATEASRLLNAVPPLFFLTLLIDRLPRLPSQLALLALCVGTGSSLVHITGRESYLLIMKQAPALGMLWVWSVVRLDLVWAVLGLAGVVGVVWGRGDLGTVWGR